MGKRRKKKELNEEENEKTIKVQYNKSRMLAELARKSVLKTKRNVHFHYFRSKEEETFLKLANRTNFM